jgi:L-ascorbate metabolism protein UlaG (beta-lactamase superfamily)
MAVLPFLVHAPQQPIPHGSRVRRWLAHLFHEWTIESWRPIAPAFAKPKPSKWSNTQLTLAWLGHSTVLINFFGVTILTDPVLLSHAHFDHLDLRTLRCFDKTTRVITARATSDLLKRTRFSDITELDWGETKLLSAAADEVLIAAIPVKHWGARTQHDTHRGYNGYLIESRSRGRRRIIFAGDTAMTENFAALRRYGPIDVAIMPISAYNPWIQSHGTPEQAVQMANAAGARFIVPVHHQTFRLSFEPLREPIERLEVALSKTPERIALREIGETFVLPL